MPPNIYLLLLSFLLYLLSYCSFNFPFLFVFFISFYFLFLIFISFYCPPPPSGCLFSFFRFCKFKIFIPLQLAIFGPPLGGLENGGGGGYGFSTIGVAELKEHIDTFPIYSNLEELYTAIDHAYYEESRAAVHFLLLLIVASDNKLLQQQILFQKFLHQSRERLRGIGISPPGEIFKSQSCSSIDIPLVAVWLSTLSEREVESFHVLWNGFRKAQVMIIYLVRMACFCCFYDKQLSSESPSLVVLFFILLFPSSFSPFHLFHPSPRWRGMRPSTTPTVDSKTNRGSFSRIERNERTTTSPP